MQTSMNGSKFSALFKQLAALTEMPKEPLLQIKPSVMSIEILQTILTSILGESISIVFPDAIETLKSDRSKNISLVKQIAGYQVEGKTVEDKSILKGKSLQKPLVMMLPEMGSNQWTVCVALPKNYKAPFGESINNSQDEVLFYMDARITNRPQEMPAHFVQIYQLLIGGCSYTETRSGNKITIPKTFSSPVMFFNGSHKQQSDIADSAGWAIYNAVMIILTGHALFAEKFSRPDANATCRLRRWVQDTISSLPVVTNSPVVEIKESTSVLVAPTESGNSLLRVMPSLGTASLPKDTLQKNEVIKKDVKESKEKPILSENKAVETFHDPSPALPPYSLQAVHAILCIHGISHQPDEKPSRCMHDQYDIYAYPCQPLLPAMFIKDTINYFLARGKEVGNRRVCFLLGTLKKPVAIIMQSSQINKTVAEKLHSLLHAKKLHTADDISKDAECLKLFRSLYKQVEGVLLGAGIQNSLVAQLQPFIVQTYENHVNFGFIEPPQVNPTIGLTEQIRIALKHGIEAGIKHTAITANVMAQHQKQCAGIFLKALHNIKEKNPEQHTQVMSYLVMLFKYLALTLQRQQRYGNLGNNLEELELLLARDKRAKELIYQGTIIVEQSLNVLDIEPLTQLLLVKDHSEQLLKNLQDSHKSQLKMLHAWEVDIKNKIAAHDKRLPYLWRKSKKGVAFVYHNSFAHLGSELLHWVGRPVVKWVSDSRIVQSIKTFNQKVMKIIVSGVTPPHLANQSAEAINYYLQQMSVPRLLKATGAGLGLAYSYYLGFYTLARMLGVSTFAFEVGEYLRQGHINDEKAIVVPPSRYFPSAANCVRIISVAFAVIETACAHDYQYLVNTVGGFTGSVTATTLGQWCLPELRVAPGQPPTEDQIFGLFLLSVSGQNLGYSMASLATDTWSTVSAKLAAQGRALKELETRVEQGEIADLKIEVPSMLLSPSLWFNGENRLNVEWRDVRTQLFSRADCQIRTLDTFPRSSELDCITTQMGPPRLNNP